MKFTKISRLGTGFRLHKNTKFLSQKVQIKKILTVTSQTPYGTNPKEVVNHAKSDVCKPGSFIKVKADTRTDIIALYTLNSKLLDIFLP